jgi:hypothetical protein
VMPLLASITLAHSYLLLLQASLLVAPTPWLESSYLELIKNTP